MKSIYIYIYIYIYKDEDGRCFHLDNEKSLVCCIAKCVALQSSDEEKRGADYEIRRRGSERDSLFKAPNRKWKILALNYKWSDLFSVPSSNDHNYLSIIIIIIIIIIIYHLYARYLQLYTRNKAFLGYIYQAVLYLQFVLHVMLLCYMKCCCPC